MPRVVVTRRADFAAAHRLSRSDWSDEKNRSVFGDCANANWHGHNYELEVSVEGPVDPETGFVMELKALKDVIERRVTADGDHRDLNAEASWPEGVMPSNENSAIANRDRITAGS